MGLFDKIFDKLLGRHKRKALPAGNEIKENEEVTDKHNEYIENLQKETKEKLNSFEGLSREQCYEKVLTMMGVDKKFLENPRAKKMIFSELSDLAIRHSKEEYLDGFNKSQSMESYMKAKYERIMNDIKKTWIISDNSIAIKSTEILNGERPIIATKMSKYLIEGTDFTIEENQKYANIEDVDRSITTDYTSVNKCTYNKDGVEIKHHASTDGLWNGRKDNKSYDIERESIDTARYSDDQGRSCILDLLGEYFDVADLTAVNVYYQGGMPENIYTKGNESERGKQIAASIEKSKFKNGCKEIYENKSIGNDR